MTVKWQELQAQGLVPGFKMLCPQLETTLWMSEAPWLARHPLPCLL